MHQSIPSFEHHINDFLVFELQVYLTDLDLLWRQIFDQVGLLFQDSFELRFQIIREAIVHILVFASREDILDVVVILDFWDLVLDGVVSDRCRLAVPLMKFLGSIHFDQYDEYRINEGNDQQLDQKVSVNPISPPHLLVRVLTEDLCVELCCIVYALLLTMAQR